MTLRLNSRWLTILLTMFALVTVAFIFILNTPISNENAPETTPATTDETVVDATALTVTDPTPLQTEPEIQVDNSADCQVLRLSYPPKCVDTGISTTFFNDEGLPTTPIAPGQ